MKSQHRAKIFFNYILIWFGLLIVSLSLGDIIFAYVDVLTYKKLAESDSLALRWAVTGLIIGIPLLTIISANIQRNIRNGIFDSDASVRSWMIYIILAFSSIVWLVSLFFLINQFISGDYDLRHVLYIVTILVIAGIIVSYYLYDISYPLSSGNIFKRLLNYLLLLSMLVVLGMGFVKMPGLQQAKEMKADATKRSQIQKINWQIDRYYAENKKLPGSLSQLVAENYLHDEDVKDAETKAEFAYKVTAPKSYEVCSTFQHKHHEYAAQWSHPAGKHCFKFITGRSDIAD